MGKSLIIASNSAAFITGEIDRIKKNLGISSGNFTDQITIRAADSKMSIGIEQLKELKLWSKTKPFKADNKLAVIEAADLMTNEAQNAALKLLEEPSPSNHYVLVSGQYSQLLPTVISRCELIYDNRIREGEYQLEQFLALDELDRFKFTERFEKAKSTPEKHHKIDQFLLALLHHCREQLLPLAKEGADTQQWLENIAVINTTKKMIDAKVTIRSALDYLLINIKLNSEMV